MPEKNVLERLRHWLWKLRLRYSLRTLLMLVLLVALGCWLFVRHREFSRRAERQKASENNLAFAPYLVTSGDALGLKLQERLREFDKKSTSFFAEANVHHALAAKYADGIFSTASGGLMDRLGEGRELE